MTIQSAIRETYTPCFDWVIEATGCQATALTYGVVWRYAQMSDARCHASCSRLAAQLAWSRQSVMRHLRRLLDIGLIVCANPGAPGVTRHYLPVSQEEWTARRQAPEGPPSKAGVAPSKVASRGEAVHTRAASAASPRVAPDPAPAQKHTVLSAAPAPRSEGVTVDDTPCHLLSQGPVPDADTRTTSRNTRKHKGTAQRRDPRILLLRKLTGRLPPAVLQAQVLSALGPEPDTERLAECYRAWCARGYNPMNYAWLFDWYTAGRIPAAPARGPATLTLDATPESFARWHAYQQAIQQGESPDEARRRLDL
ncbi:MAG: hypothetical protein GX595_20750 [Lentisphaerae bacterium]|nr:hypothetical protein [Lentisphaerota bacterium]